MDVYCRWYACLRRDRSGMCIYRWSAINARFIIQYKACRWATEQRSMILGWWGICLQTSLEEYQSHHILHWVLFCTKPSELSRWSCIYGSIASIFKPMPRWSSGWRRVVLWRAWRACWSSTVLLRIVDVWLALHMIRCFPWIWFYNWWYSLMQLILAIRVHLSSWILRFLVFFFDLLCLGSTFLLCFVFLVSFFCLLLLIFVL